MIKQSQQICQLYRCNELKEARDVGNKITISGLDELEDQTPNNFVKIFTDFFTQTDDIVYLNLIQIAFTKRIASATPRLVQVTKINAKDKSIIFKHSKNLKDTRNNEDNAYFVE